MAVPSPAEIEAAAARLRSVLEARTGADFSPSSVLGDLVVDGHGVAHADIVAEIRELQARQSLLDLRRRAPSEEVDEAADALLGNLFVDRAGGTFARGVVTLHFTRRVDVLVPRTTRFFKTPALVFYPNLAEALLVPATSLRPRYAPGGAVASWTYDLPVIAARVGAAYGVSKGRFATFDAISPYLAYVENADDFAPGLDVESTAAAVARAPTAISLRGLLNPRSNEATLRGGVAEVSRVVSVGMGDPEMRRDRRGGVSVGGHTDIYVDLPARRHTVRTVIGEAARRADGRVLTFTDPGADFVAAGVQAGDVLSVASGLPGAPMQWRVDAVRVEALDVTPDVPFAVATDEDDGTPDPVVYSVGNDYPAFSNRVAATTSADARTTRLLTLPDGAFLPAGPLGMLTRIEVIDPPSALLPFVDAATGTVRFTQRRNGPATRAPRPGEPLGYRVRCLNPAESQSARAVYVLELGWPGETLNGTEVEVTYDTRAGFDAADALVDDPGGRLINANVLARAPHPVYVACAVPYRQRTVGAFGDAVAAVDEAAVVRALVAHIEAAPPGTLDATGLGAVARAADPNVGAVLAFEVDYEVHLPDGRVARLRTSDRVELVPTDGAGARLLDPASLGLPTPPGAAFARLLEGLGLTNRVVRYVARADAVALEAR